MSPFLLLLLLSLFLSLLPHLQLQLFLLARCRLRQWRSAALQPFLLDGPSRPSWMLRISKLVHRMSLNRQASCTRLNRVK